MTLTGNEKRTVMVVFGELLRKPHSELNTYLGTLTIEEMERLYWKLKYEPYCEVHGIKYEDMTGEDYIKAYDERRNV